MEQIQAELIQLVIAVLTALAGWVTRYVVKFFKQKGILAELEENKELVKIVVKAIEQAYAHLNGEQKLEMAKEKLVELMNEKKIKISQKELDLLIEAMVREMNETIKKETNKQQ